MLGNVSAVPFSGGPYGSVILIVRGFIRLPFDESFTVVLIGKYVEFLGRIRDKSSDSVVCSKVSVFDLLRKQNNMK